MKNAISKKQIVEEFEKYGNNLVCISFNPDLKGTARVITYSGLNIHSAFRHIVVQAGLGYVVKTYLLYDQDVVNYLPANLHEAENSDLVNFELKPDYFFGKK